MIKKFFNRGFYTGVDVAERQINAVQIRLKGGKPEVTGSGTVSLSAKNTEINNEELANSLRQCFAKINYRGEPVITALPNHQLLMGTATFPLLSGKELATAAHYETCNQFQINERDYITEHLPINIDEEEEQIEVLLIAAPLGQIHRYHQVFKLAGLKLSVIDIYPAALWRLSRNRLTKPGFSCAMLHLDGANTQLLMVADKKIQYVRPLNYQGKEGAALVEEVNRALALYAYRPNHKPIEKIILTGVEDLHMVLVQYLEAKLGLPVHTDSTLEPALAMAFGLAVRESDP
ncbi:type IV pilus biogenesis protein PilM [Desulfofalx alkaliphila]|uniref:type IV pilus biogenesis protein PilM n=1 Tax=Desulfofalx alkaliphila TaxID=105483 RepID=UPI0004E23104|nr:pilus assembly protein PilM [Desulfofalx alkaliphila]